MQTLTHNIEQLIKKCRKKDESAYFEIYNLYAKMMYNTAYRILNNATDAEDIMQEAFIKAFDNIRQFNMDTDHIGNKFGSWLKRIVINHSLNAVKSNNQYYREALSVVPDVSETIDNSILDKYDVNQVLGCISQLKDKYRVALTLNLIEGYDYQDIAKIMNLSYQNVRTITSRAKQQVVELYKSAV